MTRRRGISLVELLTVMSGFVVLLSLCAGLMHKAMQTQSRTRYFFEAERTALRLADQFRADVHRALALEAESEDASGVVDVLVLLSLPGNEKVSYRREGASVVRILSHEDDVVSRENFALTSLGELAVEELDSPRRLTLTLAVAPEETLPSLGRPAAGVRVSPVSFQVTAVAGRDWRHMTDADEEAAP